MMGPKWIADDIFLSTFFRRNIKLNCANNAILLKEYCGKLFSLKFQISVIFSVKNITFTFLHFYFLLYSKKGISIGMVKSFDFWFLMDLNVLGCPEHDFNIFKKYMSLCICTKYMHSFPIPNFYLKFFTSWKIQTISVMTFLFYTWNLLV